MEWTFTTNVDMEALVESLCENRDFKQQIACQLNTYDIANELSVSDIAYEIDMSDLASEVAGLIEDHDVARAIDLDDLAQAFDYDDLCEKIAEHMPDNANNDDFRALQQQVNTLTQTVERLMGVLDWSLDNMRMGIVHIDTNQDFTLGTGIEPVEPKPVWTIEEVLEQEARVDQEFFSIPMDQHAQTQGWNDRPNYL